MSIVIQSSNILKSFDVASFFPSGILILIKFNYFSILDYNFLKKIEPKLIPHIFQITKEIRPQFTILEETVESYNSKLIADSAKNLIKVKIKYFYSLIILKKVIKEKTDLAKKIAVQVSDPSFFF